MTFLRYIPVLLAIFSLTGNGICQAPLSLREAIDRGLDYQYSIRILRNNEIIAANNNTAGNAGMLPTVNLFGDYTYAVQSSEQEFFSGETRIASNAPNKNLRLGAAIDWTVFDGFRMFATRDKLELLESQSRIETQVGMHQLVADIQLVYSNLSRLNNSIAIYERAVELDRDLVELAENRLRIGTATSLDVLQAKTQLQADSVRLVGQKAELARISVSFNRLIGNEPGDVVQVDTTLAERPLPPYDTLLALARQNNAALNVLQLDVAIAEKTIDEAKSLLWPRLDLFAGYNYNNSRSEIGFLLSNNTYGPQVGVGFTYDIYSGRNLKKDIQSARLLQENANLTVKDYSDRLASMLAESYVAYETSRNLVRLEEKNIDLAVQNSQLARDLFRAGRITDFEVREAQLRETEAYERLLDAQYNMKVAEIRLLFLAGQPLYLVQ